MSTPDLIYTCRACETERALPELMAAAGPAGTGWYCRDLVACREARRGQG